MIDWTLTGRAVKFVLTSRAVSYLVTPPVAGNTKHISCWRGRTFELILQTLVILTVSLITGVSTLVPAVTDLGGVSAVLVIALELTRGADKGRTVLRLVQTVTAVVLRVTPPPEWNTFEGVGAQKLTPAAVGPT